MKEIVYKRYGVVKIFMLIKGLDKDSQEKTLDFVLPLYFSYEHISKIETEWNKIIRQKNRPELIPLKDMQELSALLPRVELMYLNHYITSQFSISQIEKFIKNITIDRYNWEIITDNDKK